MVKDNKMELQTFKFKGNFLENHGAPPVLKVIVTLNAFMTDNVWNVMTLHLQKTSELCM